jgi:hypothetical protein
VREKELDEENEIYVLLSAHDRFNSSLIRLSLFLEYKEASREGMAFSI